MKIGENEAMREPNGVTMTDDVHQTHETQSLIHIIPHSPVWPALVNATSNGIDDGMTVGGSVAGFNWEIRDGNDAESEAIGVLSRNEGGVVVGRVIDISKGEERLIVLGIFNDAQPSPCLVLASDIGFAATVLLFNEVIIKDIDLVVSGYSEDEN